MPDLALQLIGVRKSYDVGTPIETEVLHGVELAIAQGELVAVIGPSGSGKSTLLNIIGLLDRPTAGRLALLGQETTGLDEAEITRLRGREIGFVFQYHHLIAAFSALENVLMPMLVARGWPDAAMQARAQELLERVGLGAFAANKATNLSGGQQQRVAVARALAAGPRLLLADEPTGNLDSEAASAVFDLLMQVNREFGTTVLIVTHNMALAERCRRTVQVIDGRIVA